MKLKQPTVHHFFGRPNQPTTSKANLPLWPAILIISDSEAEADPHEPQANEKEEHRARDETQGGRTLAETDDDVLAIADAYSSSRMGGDL